MVDVVDTEETPLGIATFHPRFLDREAESVYWTEPTSVGLLLDVGGGANVETVRNGFKIILADPHVKAILINIFGGIVRCDRVAQGVIEAVESIHVDLPIVVRLEGTNAEEAAVMLRESTIDFMVANSLEDAAQKVVSVI